MTKKSNREYNAAKRKELDDRVSKELQAYEDKSFLEQYALYMARVQIYELSLKQDLQHLFNVPEEKADGMNLASILRYYVKNDIRAHPILYANLTDIAQQRNIIAHEFLVNAEIMGHLVGIEGIQLLHRDLAKWAWELELAFQQYLMLKETGMLYMDYGVKPTYPYPPDVGDNINPERLTK